MKRDFLSMDDISIREIIVLIKASRAMKAQPIQDMLENKTIAMLFEKPSTRTRLSFEIAMKQLGGSAIFLDSSQTQLGRGETISDTAHIFGRYVDGVVARLGSHKDLIELSRNCFVPVINALTDQLHPCQALSDLFTIHEKKGKLKGLKLAFLGDGSDNVCHSLMNACHKMGITMSIACPTQFSPDKKIMAKTKDSVVVHEKVQSALKDADILYTDTWVSMGDEAGRKNRIKALKPFQLNTKALRYAKKDALVMHNLPAHRGMEVTAEVLDGPRSIIWDQAENRIHAQKALLAMFI